MSSFSGARSKLKNATQDLFRLPGQSIPVETRSIGPRSLPPERVVTSAKPASATPPEAPPASARKAEASIMFSLEELMKAANPVEAKADDAPDQLWSMQAATPLFGTANDEALLTTPMKTETGSGMDSMTMPSHPPPGRRWLPMVLAIGGCSLAVAVAAWWALEPTLVDPAPAAQVAAAAIPELPASAASPAAEVAPAEAPPAAVATAPGVAEPSAEVPVAPSSDVTPVVAATTPSASKAVPSTSQVATKKKPAAPSSTKSAAFDKAAAKNALNSAASKAAGCRQTGAGGQGKIQLTFAPTGKVTSAQIMAGPSASTAEGKCALRHFRAARIPAFSGAPVTVAKSFKIP
jgi:hypothetical protein